MPELFYEDVPKVLFDIVATFPKQSLSRTDLNKMYVFMDSLSFWRWNKQNCSAKHI